VLFSNASAMFSFCLGARCFLGLASTITGAFTSWVISVLVVFCFVVRFAFLIYVVLSFSLAIFSLCRSFSFLYVP